MRNSRLDSIRGLSALLIFVFHINGYTNSADSMFSNAIDHILSNMYIGVDLFFILSGYSLMKYTRFQAEASSWICYVRRRFLRVVPAYYLTSCLWLLLPMAKFILVSLFPLGQYSQSGTFLVDFHMLERLLANFLFVQWYLPQGDWILSGVTWTLVVEVQFYLLFPIFIRYVRGVVSFRGVVTTTCIAVILEMLFRNTLNAGHVYMKTVIPYLPLFILGATLAESAQRKRFLRGHTFLMFGLMSAATGLFVIDPNGSALVTSLKALCGSLTSVFLFCLALSIKVPDTVEKSLSLFGMVSFSFYLVHLNISDRVTQLVFRFIQGAFRIPVAICLSFVLSLIVAMLFYVIVEDWKNLKDRAAKLVKTR